MIHRNKEIILPPSSKGRLKYPKKKTGIVLKQANKGMTGTYFILSSNLATLICAKIVIETSFGGQMEYNITYYMCIYFH